MIERIAYEVERGGATYALNAHKDVRTRNDWHLKSISGNGLPPVSTEGASTYGIAGKSYSGLVVDGREIEAELYADAFSPVALQSMMDGVSSIVTPANDTLGVLRLWNANGGAYRIAAKCTDFDVDELRRRSNLCSAVFDCPYSWFEDDTLRIMPLFAVEGGKEYPLTRPYTFGNIAAGAKEQTLVAVNDGDVPAPCTFRLFGAGLSAVEITNETTGAVISASGMSVGGIEINTDVNNAGAWFSDGADASRFVSLYSDITDFLLQPGANTLRVKMTASSVTAAGTCVEWRGRYATCL